MRKIIAFLFFLCACMTAQVAWSMGTFSITRENNYFVIHRTDASFAQTVKYRTVSMSALAGQHFTGKTGEVTFASGKDTVHVTVNETAIGLVSLIFRYQSFSYRRYLFEVTDVNGYLLASYNRDIEYGSNYRFQNDYTSQSITDLVYFNNGSMRSGISRYYDVAGTTAETKVTDAGYKNNPYSTVNTSDFFSHVPASREYLNIQGYKLYATVYFDQKEEADGYQYIQIVEGTSTSSYDTGDDPNGGVNTPSNSLYKACFILSYDKEKETNYHKQFFPHRYNYTDFANYSTSHNEFSHSDSHLYAQAYKNNTYKAANSGSLVLSPMVNNLTIRFDAGGGGNSDNWYFRNLYVRFALCDSRAPSITSGGITVSAGPYAPGQTVYVSVPFDESVTFDDGLTLSTTWGTFTYAYGKHTNVATFRGAVPAGNTSLRLNSFSGTITDVAGNSLSSGALNMNMGVKPLSSYTLSASNTFIDVPDTIRDNGGAQTPTPTVTYYTGTEAHTLTAGTDYTVSYANNDGLGTATITITAKGNYTGSVSKNFVIRGVNLTDFSKSGNYNLISSVEDLELLSLLVNRNNSKQSSSTWFKQTADIDFEGGSLKPIGNVSNPFKGKYYGDGHTISHLNITAAQDEQHTGLFGCMNSSAEVKGLRLDSCTISGYMYVGAIAGECRGTISNCRVESTVTVQPANTQESYQCFGGIVGRLFSNSVHIYGCYCAATVTNNGKDNCSNFGGIVGLAFVGYAYFVEDNIYAGSTVEADGNVGAIIGLNSSDDLRATNNVYLNGDLPGGVNGADVRGASRAYTISLDEGVLLTGSRNIYTLSGYQATKYAILTDTAIYSGDGNVIYVHTGDSLYYTPVFRYHDGVTTHNVNSSSFTMPAANVSVSVAWTPIEYGLYYDLGEGHWPAGQSNPTTFTVESGTITLVNPEKEGYVFAYWSGTDLDEPTKTITIPTGSHGSRNYTAHYDEIVQTDETSYRSISNDLTIIDECTSPYDINQRGQEECESLLDQNLSSKWCVVQDTSNFVACSIDFHLPEARGIVGYQLTTGDDIQDFPVRNPSAWRLYARLDTLDVWTLIDERDAAVNTEDSLPAINTTSAIYTVPAIGSYRYFRFVIDSINGVPDDEYEPSIMQLAELNLLSYMPNVVFPMTAREANCEHPANITCWYRNGNYYSDEACTTPINENNVWINYVPTEVTHYNSCPATLKHVGYAEECWTTECGYIFADEHCTTLYHGEIIEGGHYDSKYDRYWVRLLQNGERTIVLDNTIESFHVYDDGAYDYYSNGCDGALVLVAPENYKLLIEGWVVTESGNCDYLKIFDGTTAADDLLGLFYSLESGEERTIDPIETTGRNVRLFFHSDGSLKYDGFNLTVTLVPPAGDPTDIDHVQRDNVPCTKIIRDGQLLIERNGKLINVLGQPIN